jgi:cullin 3
MSVNCFKNFVILKQSNRIHKLMIEHITKDRDGEQTNDRNMLKNITNMLMELDKEGQNYTKIFETNFITASHAYFKKEAQDIFNTSTAVQFLQRVKKRLQEETQRAERCFATATKAKIEDVLKAEMIETYKDMVVKKEGSGVHVMLVSKKAEELALVYEILSKVVGALKPTMQKLQDYCKEEGEKIVTDKKKDETPIKLVLELIDLRVYYDNLLLQSFATGTGDLKIRDKEFSKAVKDAFDHVVNLNPRFPEYLSLLLDSKLGKGAVHSTSLDVFFDQVIMIFRHVKEKDVFEKYYKNHLANRLLLKGSSSDDDEQMFLTKLKTEFGYQFTSKLEGMFKDMKISIELMDEYKKKVILKNNEKETFDLNVKVLTPVNWPITQTEQCDLSNCSSDLLQSCDSFKNFYLTKHSGRKLNWQFNMGNADIKMNGFEKKFEVNVSTYQMIILLLFNNIEEISISSIIEKIKVPYKEVMSSIVSLFAPLDKSEKNSKILIRVADKKDEKDDDKKDDKKDKKKVNIDKTTVIKPNDTFKSKKLKNTVKSITKKQDTSAVKEINDAVNEERKWVVDAVIVRNMKAKRTMKHSTLINEVQQQLHNRFLPTSTFIKTRIESLIERDYLERSQTEENTYNYLA